VRGGEPVQVIHPVPDTPFLWPELDLSGLAEAEREARIQELAAAAACKPFDLEHGPLLRTTWGQLAEDEYFGLFTLHHIITDQLSHVVFLRELSTLYDAFVRGEPSPLPDLPIQYADYAIW